MAVVTTKTTRISNAESVVQTIDSVGVNHGRLRRVVATVEAVSGDSIGSKYIFFRVHSSWTVASLRLFCDAITTCAGDIGLYQTNANPNNGGAVVSATTYGSAVSLATAITTGTTIATATG